MSSQNNNSNDRSDFSNEVLELHAVYTAKWHDIEIDAPTMLDALKDLVIKQHRFNFDLWHEEDKAREPGAEDGTIAGVKRNIDALNQNRNDAITQIDLLLQQTMFKQFSAIPDLPWNSETVGSVVDRLSIASLKVFHMQEQVDRADASQEHIVKCRHALGQLHEQRDDLAQALQELLEDILRGKKQNKLYHQFKMYNDPSLNPKIYEAGEN